MSPFASGPGIASVTGAGSGDGIRISVGAVVAYASGERTTSSIAIPSSRVCTRTVCTPEVAKYTSGPSRPTLP